MPPPARDTVVALFQQALELPRWWSGNGVSELLTPVGQVVPVLGAGVSRDAELPDAGQLAEWLANSAPMIEAPANGRALFGVVDTVDPSQMPAAELKQTVADYIKSFPLRSTPLLDELVRLPSRFIVTLNYDDILGFAAEEQGLKVRRLSALNRDEMLEAHRLLTTRGSCVPSELTVLHLHGRVQEPQTLVLDQASYKEISRDPTADELVFALTHYRSLVFLGTTLDENYLLAKLEKQINAGFHLVLCHEDEVAKLTAGRGALSQRQHLRVVDYPDHSDLMVLPRWLNAPQEPRGPQTNAGILDVSTAPNAEDYVSSNLVEHGMASMAVGEEDIRDGQRTVIVGAAGTGKTHLLSWLAANAPAERRAVQIRLADVRIAPGKPESILASWAQQSRSAPGHPTVDVSAAALHEDRLHFLLDGLDEVANELQEEAASLIDQVAQRYPQHAFTVTSRPLAALTALGYGERPETTLWRLVELTPGAAWQKRYLDSRGLTLAQLEAAMPALTDMRELLHIPFFLTRTVELFANEQLAGLRDVGELLERLVDFSLSREEGLLPLVGCDGARAWLRRVALAATIAGRRSLTLTELKKVHFADELAGNLDQLVEQLQQRLLLIEEDGRLRFSHRLISDELAAEALAMLEPSETLLDSLVPVVDEQLAGVRDDVTIPVALVCLRSAAWRAAVARRDPLAAARATPSDATESERTAAVELLWSTYEKWRVWAWDRSTPDLLEDTEVIARLLRHDPEGDQVIRLRELMHIGDEVQQGNALRILARVTPAGLADDLRRVLRDTKRNGVVIRQAMIAAADLELTELIDDIILAMLKSSDTAVRQDGSIALADLTPDDQLLDVARQLVSCSEDAFFISSVRTRMSPTERIELARALAMARTDELAEDRTDFRTAAGEVTPNANVVRAAASAAAFWSEESDEIMALLDHDPQAAAEGLLEARDNGADWWSLASFVSHANLDVLRTADVDKRIIRAAEQALEFNAMSPEQKDEMRRTIEQSMAEQREARERERPPIPKLAELLRQPASERDSVLQARAFDLRGQVRTLDGDTLSELRARIKSSWPAGPFNALVHVGDNKIVLKDQAPVWLFLAPAANVPVTDEQWAQLATQPIIHSEQSSWLRQYATHTAMQGALALMTDNHARAWHRLLDCCTAPPPAFIVEACTASVETDLSRPDDTTYLMQRLVAGGVTNGALAWASRDLIAARALRPLLALEGDVEAQQLLVKELLKDIRDERPWSRHDLGWMPALHDPQFLDALFEIIEKAYRPFSGDTSTRLTWTLHDVLTPTIEAVATIGGRDAVRGYDALLTRSDDLRWFRDQRDRIAAQVLHAKGAAASAPAAAVAGIPPFSSAV